MLERKRLIVVIVVVYERRKIVDDILNIVSFVVEVSLVMLLGRRFLIV